MRTRRSYGWVGVRSGPGAAQALLRLLLRLRLEVVELRALGLAAVAVFVRVLRPRAAVAAPSLARVGLLVLVGHGGVLPTEARCGSGSRARRRPALRGWRSRTGRGCW